MHCYFVLAGDSGVPVIYDVENVRDGRSFATRTVQARQRGEVIFSVTMSFYKGEKEGAQILEHQVGFDGGLPPGEEEGRGEGGVGGVFERRAVDRLPGM
jgi:acyl-CoA thioesterase 8